MSVKDLQGSQDGNITYTLDCISDKRENFCTKSDTVDGYIFLDTNFRGLNQIGIIMGLKVFSFIVHTENCYFLGTELCGLDPPQTTKIGTQGK